MNRYGRINRATYFLCLAILAVIWGVAAAYKARIPGEILIVLITIPRLHDIGRSAWWTATIIGLELAVVAGILPFVNGAHMISIAEIASGLVAILLWLLMMVLGGIPGQEGVNKYGAPPPSGVSFKTYRMTKSAAEAEAEAF